MYLCVFEHTPAKHPYMYEQGTFLNFKVTWAAKKILILIILQNISICARSDKNHIAYVCFIGMLKILGANGYL